MSSSKTIALSVLTLFFFARVAAVQKATSRGQEHGQRAGGRPTSHGKEYFGFWDGDDAAPVPHQDIEFFANMTKGYMSNFVAAKYAQQLQKVHIFGLYNTGTNVMQSLLHASAPAVSVCPDTDVHYEATGDRTCLAKEAQSKHANPLFVRKFLEAHADTFGIFLVRDPFSNLDSYYTNPYKLRACFTGDSTTWLSSACDCKTMRYPDPLCTEFQTHYANVVDVWSTYVEGYETISKDLESRSLLIRYEDLVMEPAHVLGTIFAKIGLHCDADIDSMDASAKASGRGRQKAIEKIKRRPYLERFTNGEKREVCENLHQTICHQLSYDSTCQQQSNHSNR